MARSGVSRAVKLTGTETAEAKRQVFSAGDISVMFDAGGLRYLAYRGAEVLRGIAYLIRDKNWGTYAPVISGLKAISSKGGFSIRYTATCRDDEQAISYDASIDATPDGVLRFTVAGTPLSDFVTNRTGFVVLHPLDGVVGAPVEIVHTTGERQKTRFPKFISPGQPVFDIRSLKHTVMPGVTATVLMEGNKFEMEDHRNWMDASYKTYVCSLLDPWPYRLNKGETFTQSITVTLAGKPAGRSRASTKATTEIVVGGGKGNLPHIGVAVPMAEAETALHHAALIRMAGLKHVVGQIDGRRGGQKEVAAALASLRARTGTSSTLEIILPAAASAEQEMEAIAQQVREAGYRPDAVVVTQAHDLKSFQPGAQRPWGPSYEEMAEAARASFAGVPVGGGMLSFFTELNRKPVPQGLFDFVTHSVCPIVHAADDLSVMETLQALPSIIASTRNMMGKTPYHLGSSSIACRDNPYGAAVAANPGTARVCLAAVDPRQRGLFAAAWNIGVLAAAAAGGLARVTLGAATGPQGVIHTPGAAATPGYGDGATQVYPVYHVLAGLAPLSGRKCLTVNSSSPARIAALGVQAPGGKELWLANLSNARQNVSISGLAGAATIHRLNASTFAKLIKTPAFLATEGETLKRVSRLELDAYEVVRIRTAAK